MWEYKTVYLRRENYMTIENEVAKLDKQLNALGAADWEMVGVVFNEDDGRNAFVVFKRRK